MSRLPPISDRESPPGVVDITRRSSTEDHEDQKSRDMSVADRLTPDFFPSQKSPFYTVQTTVDHCVHKRNIQNNNKTSGTSVNISPRNLSSRAYVPTPYRRSVTPAFREEPRNVKVPECERTVVPETRPLTLPPVKVPRYFSPLPYNRSCTPFSPVNWQCQAVADAVVVNSTAQSPSPEDLHKGRLSQISNGSSHSFRNYSPLPPIPATISKPPEAKGRIADPTNMSTEIKPERSESRESAKKELLGSTVDHEMKIELKRKENERQELLINMAYQEPQKPRKLKEGRQIESKIDQKKAKTETGKARELSEEKTPPPEDSEEMLMLKMVFEEHLKTKDDFEKQIEKREEEINEQLREMDELLESVQAERLEVEKTAGEFADAMMKYTNFKEEATRVRVKHMEQEISSEILFEENEELKKEIRELLDEINAIKEKRAIGLDGIQKDIEEMDCVAEMLREKNDETEADIKEKAKEFSRLRMLMSEQGITYVSDRKPVKEHGLLEAPKPVQPQTLTVQTEAAGDAAVDIDDKDILPEFSPVRHGSRPESNELERNEKCIEETAVSKDHRSEYGNLKTTERFKVGDIEDSCAHGFDGRGDIMQLTKYSDVLSPGQENGGDVRTETGTSLGHDEPAEIKKQLFQTDQLELCEVRKRRSRIPRPIIQPFGSASRDADRYVVSRSNSMVVYESDRYRRDNFVPEDERYIIRPRTEFLEPQTELQSIKKSTDKMIVERHTELTKTKDTLEYETRAIADEQYPQNYRGQDTYCQGNPTRTRIKRKEIKSKIDTGLKCRPNSVSIARQEKQVRKGVITDKAFDKNKKETEKRLKKFKETEKQIKKQDKVAGKKQPCVKTKEMELPPLRNTPRTSKHSNRKPTSSKSFDDRMPLPKIRSKNRETVREMPHLPPIKQKPQAGLASSQTALNKQEAISKTGNPKAKLPPLSKEWRNIEDFSLTGNKNCRQSRLQSRLSPIVPANNQLVYENTVRQKPEALWISLSPSPPLDCESSIAKMTKPGCLRRELE